MTVVSRYFDVVFAILGVAVLVWFGLVATLFKRLKRDHPEKYCEMGEPRLIMINSLRANFAFLKFMFRREDRALNDPALSRLTLFMMCFLACYLVLFSFLWFSLP